MLELAFCVGDELATSAKRRHLVRNRTQEEGSEELDTAGLVRWRILAVLLTAIFMSLAGVSIVNAVPSIQGVLDVSQSDA